MSTSRTQAFDADQMLRTLLLGGATIEYAHQQVARAFGHERAKKALQEYHIEMNKS